jgi:3-hydroxypropanoate dehydrogenase
MTTPLDAAALDRLFRKARTYGTTASSWLARPVDDATLERLWELTKWGPTSANCSPLRVVFVRSPEAKAKLRPALSAGNVDKTMAAPVTAIMGTDTRYYDKLPFLFPHTDARSWFAGKPNQEITGFRNATLQAGYFILAARALGLDCGPMSGFDNAAVDAAFFPDGGVRSNFLVNLGYGDPASLFPRSPRLGFAEACSIT